MKNVSKPLLLDIELYGEHYKVYIELKRYVETRGLAIMLNTLKDGPFAHITKNLGEILNHNEAYIDTNNNPWVEKLIAKYELGIRICSKNAGYCLYPLYRFDMAKLYPYTYQGGAE